MMRKIIGDYWKTYLEDVVLKDAVEIEIEKTRLAFFGGAGILFGIIVDKLNGSDKDIDDLEFILTDISNELAEFDRQIDLECLGENIH